ncbi:MAG: macro domain-containing protein [Candidatus Omnitrophica bacterium]|jgi:O-acetyl-ADP-ribose deacetylase (regulator of RNase III)|nr:macro domain-containing protein [Candidatus Omnitrophota bacterium]
MLEEIEKDITLIDEGFIVHQVNCRGRMGSGVAGQLRKKYPIIFNGYSKVIKDYYNNGEADAILGTNNIVTINDNLKIVNAFMQYDYGYDGKLYTSYEAIKSCFTFLKLVNIKHKPVYIPFKIGCGLGGGDWKTVESIIFSVYPEVIVCRRSGDK